MTFLSMNKRMKLAEAILDRLGDEGAIPKHLGQSADSFERLQQVVAEEINKYQTENPELF